MTAYLLLKVFCACLIVTGGAFVTVGLVRYHKMVNFIRLTGSGVRESFVQRVPELFLVFFLVGFCVGFLHVSFNEVAPVFLFISVVFFAGGLFLYFLILNQDEAYKALAEHKHKIILAFVRSIELKDIYTKGHSEHVYNIVKLLYEYLPSEQKASIAAPMLFDAALLHDVGKIGVPELILNKKGRLSEEEMATMREHVTIGKEVLGDLCHEAIGDWVLHHHERVDGAGYLATPADEIPLEAQIITVADTFSALTTDRVYRRAVGYDQAIAEVRRVAGTQLNASLVACLASIPQDELMATVDGLASGVAPEL